MEDLTKPKIDLRETETVLCEKCGGQYFVEVFLLKKVSRLLTGSSEDTLVPFPVNRCADCGNINKGFNPFDETNEIIEAQ